MQLSQNGQRLAGKVALVTGIGGGIGKGCALLFARQGATVVGTDINAAAAQITVDLALDEGLAFESIHPVDLTKEAAVKELVAQAAAVHGGFDILVNAAAYCDFAPIEALDYETQWKPSIVGELDIVFLACQAAWPQLIARGGGSIINFASANARQVLRGSPALVHCATKGGVLSMTLQLAMEGGPHGIRANTISPGLVATEATRHLVNDPARLTELNDKHMLGRIGQPEDIAWAAVFLASDEAGWVTGADFPIDGGASKW